MFDPSKAEVVKTVTVPFLKPEVDQPVYVRFMGKIYTGKVLKNATTTEEAAKKPPQIANVDNLVTGEHNLMIVPKALESILMDEYENHKYVGKCFKLVKLAKRANKRGDQQYSPFLVDEIKDPDTKASKA